RSGEVWAVGETAGRRSGNLREGGGCPRSGYPFVWREHPEMTQPTPRPAGPPLPRGLLVAGRLLIGYHPGAVALNVLSAPSGPWPAMEGADMALPPQLAASAHAQLPLPYLPLVNP